MRLSKYFTLDQLCHSDTAEKHGIPNVPGPTEIHNLTLLSGEILDYLYEDYGAELHISNAFRCRELNTLITRNLKSNSEHILGLAADITIDGVKPIEILKFIMSMHFPIHQVIAERDKYGAEWLHVSHRSNRPDIHVEFMVATDLNADGKMEYKHLTEAT
jgi:hypothetical protein